MIAVLFEADILPGGQARYLALAAELKLCLAEQDGFIYPSYFKLLGRWLRSFTPVTYSSKLPGILSLAAFKQLELFRVYIWHVSRA